MQILFLLFILNKKKSQRLVLLLFSDMSLALSTIHSQHFMPIPVARNKARTKAGNSLCCCIESLGTNLFNEGLLLDPLYLQCKYIYFKFFIIL